MCRKLAEVDNAQGFNFTRLMPEPTEASQAISREVSTETHPLSSSSDTAHRHSVKIKTPAFSDRGHLIRAIDFLIMCFVNFRC